MTATLREKAGLTLPEVMLAAVIIAVAVLALVGLFPTALQNVRYGGHMSQASSLAQEMIELIRTRSFSEVSQVASYVATNGPLDTRNPTPPTLPLAVKNHLTQWRTDIAPLNPAGALPQGWGTIAVVAPDPVALPDLLQVTIIVGWRESGNQTITIVTYVARYG
ncbi:MAG: type IV pilus modification PilV family protein [Candidatus Methylomirabilales bacterium]